jgi:bifunctional UDP-N-acetylglucosamine pyrophosphorylase/glucosamine-1-phosphate N-acetyltransferase
MSLPGFAAVILAAGEGTRLNSAHPKVLHEVAGQAMIRHVIAALEPLEPAATVVVIGRGMAAVARAVTPLPTAIQSPARGTGDAVRTARTLLADRLTLDPMSKSAVADIVVLYGDTPLIRTETIAALLEARRRVPEAAVAVAGFRPADPAAYGRLVLDRDDHLARIVEARDATPDELALPLCNGGIMAIEAGRGFGLIDEIGNDNAKREFYLTDLVGIATRHGLLCRAIEAPEEDVLGVNTREELAAAEAVMQNRLRRRAICDGATLVAPETVFLCADTKLGRDVVVEPHVVFGPAVTVADNARIRSFSHIEGARIASGAIVGPFARLRPGAVLEDDVHVGNFVEVKATRLGTGVKANHLSYLGDSDIGAGTNIGAGTITCNYDGFNKQPTTIGERAFIGSNTALVAPVSIGDGAYVATGSVVTSNVPADALTIARARQIDKPGGGAKLRARLQAERARASKEKS